MDSTVDILGQVWTVDDTQLLPRRIQQALKAARDLAHFEARAALADGDVALSRACLWAGDARVRFRVVDGDGERVDGRATLVVVPDR